MLLNEKIRELRMQKGWSQESLGKETGMSQSEICKIEKGKIALHTYQLKKFAEVFKIDFEELNEMLPAYNKKFETAPLVAQIVQLRILPNNKVIVPQNDEAALCESQKKIFNEEPDDTKRFYLIDKIIGEWMKRKERMKNYREIAIVLSLILNFCDVDAMIEW